jgi:hypothetical protein
MLVSMLSDSLFAELLSVASIVAQAALDGRAIAVEEGGGVCGRAEGVVRQGVTAAGARGG